MNSQQFIETYKLMVKELSSEKGGDEFLNDISKSFNQLEEKYTDSEIVIVRLPESHVALVTDKFSEDMLEFSDKYNHYGISGMDVKVDVVGLLLPCELDLSPKDILVVKVRDLLENVSLPEFQKTTLNNILSLPREESSLTIPCLIDDDGILGDRYDLCFIEDHYSIKMPDTIISTLLEYCDDPVSGKYGKVLSVITYKGVDVALVETSGKWTNEHDVTPINNLYKDFVEGVKETYLQKQDDDYTMYADDVFPLYRELETVFYKKMENK